MKKRLEDWLLLTFLPPLAAGLIRLFYGLLRVEIIGEESPRGLWRQGENVILAFWHDQLLLMAAAYRGPGATILISASRDGELIARTMRFFGQRAVRGSSTRGGRAAFRALVELARQPVDLVLTPDGPKGPRHRLKDGVVQLARLSGRAVVPMAFACSRGHRFASWDRFLLPYPFARGVFAYGEPVRFGPGEEPQAFQERLQRAMQENEERARHRLRELGHCAV